MVLQQQHQGTLLQKVYQQNYQQKNQKFIQNISDYYTHFKIASYLVEVDMLPFLKDVLQIQLKIFRLFFPLIIS